MTQMKQETLRVTIKTCLAVFAVVFVVLLSCNQQTMAAEVSTDTTESISEDATQPLNLSLTMDTGSDEGTLSGTLQMLLVITVISLAPSILVMMTSFTRIIVVLHFVRTALGLTSTPPNNVLIGLSLFLTVFIMSPVFTKINTDALQPLAEGELTQEEALDAAMNPLRNFMINQTREQDVQLFLDIADIDSVNDWDDVPTTVIIPAFIISEL